MFAGHPSLRLGDAVHFVKMWRNSPANSIIFVGESKNDAVKVEQRVRKIVSL